MGDVRALNWARRWVPALCFWRTFSTQWGGEEWRLEHQVHCAGRWNQRPLKALSLEVCFVIKVHENPSLQVPVCNSINGTSNDTEQHCCICMVWPCSFCCFSFVFCRNWTHPSCSPYFFGHKACRTLPGRQLLVCLPPRLFKWVGSRAPVLDVLSILPSLEVHFCSLKFPFWM